MNSQPEKAGDEMNEQCTCLSNCNFDCVTPGCRCANHQTGTTSNSAMPSAVAIENAEISAEQAWLEFWGSTCPDCGPTNYGWMLKTALNAYRENRKLREALYEALPRTRHETICFVMSDTLCQCGLKDIRERGRVALSASASASSLEANEKGTAK